MNPWFSEKEMVDAIEAAAADAKAKRDKDPRWNTPIFISTQILQEAIAVSFLRSWPEEAHHFEFPSGYGIQETVDMIATIVGLRNRRTLRDVVPMTSFIVRRRLSTPAIESLIDFDAFEQNLVVYLLERAAMDARFDGEIERFEMLAGPTRKQISG